MLVKSFRRHLAARALTVIFLMIAWLVATNHCALGLMKATVQAKAEHSHRHGGETAPAKDTPGDGLRACCKTIQGAPVPEKAEVKFDATKFQLQLVILIPVLAPQIADGALVSPVFNHRPPRVVSFAESVLQRSLLSHAPPFTA